MQRNAHWDDLVWLDGWLVVLVDTSVRHLPGFTAHPTA